MQFTIKKRIIDPKIQLGVLMCVLVGGYVFYNAHSISNTSLIVALILLALIILLILPYLISSIVLNFLRLRKFDGVDYKYLEFGDNGLFFTYEDKDTRFDTNIKEIKIKNCFCDYIFSFGNDKKVLIFGEKGESWQGEYNYSFMFLAKLIARVKHAGFPLKLAFGWKVKEISEDIKNGKEFKIELKESNFSFEKILMNNKGIIINKHNKEYLIRPENIKCHYLVKTPKENYWLKFLGFSNKYLVVSTVNGWIICKI